MWKRLSMVRIGAHEMKVFRIVAVIALLTGPAYAQTHRLWPRKNATAEG
jgi:hypothetical protein